MSVFDKFGKAIEESIGTMFIVLLAFGVWLLGDKLPSFSNEADMYYVMCLDSAAPSACSTKNKLLEHFTYKAIPEAQAVVYWTRDGQPHKFSSCAVRNAMNWSCNDSGQRIGMQDGKYTDRSNSSESGAADYLQVPKWQWYVYKFNALFI